MNKIKYLTLIVCITALFISLFWFTKNRKPVSDQLPTPGTEVSEATKTAEEFAKNDQVLVENVEKSEKTIPSKEDRLPGKILIPVPFTSQAPFAVWDERHEEACEEASLLMVAYFLKGKKINREIAETELQKMIDFQIRSYGEYRDSDAAGVVRLAKDYFSIQNLKAVYDFDKETLKKELAKGKPVIVLAAGRKLGNPNFTAPGPLYHALVLVGYEGNTIITNDPGTRKGEGYRYDLDTLYEAIHEFPGSKEKILEGRKAMIVIQGDN